MSEQQPETSKPEWAKTKADFRREAGQKPSKLKWLIFLLIIVAIVAVVVVNGIKAKQDEALLAQTTPAEAETLNVKYLASAEVSQLQNQTLRQEIKVTGSLSPLTQTQLPALISAQVETVRVRPGDTVSKAQVLVTMDTESLNIQKEQQLSAIAATQAQLSLAQSQLKRTQEMSSQGIAPASQLEQALSNVQAQQANLNAQKSQIKATDYQLRNATIFAPFNAVVSHRQAEPGQFVAAGSPLLALVDLSVMEFKVNVSAADSARIKQGMNVNVKVEGIAEPFNGVVSRISPLASQGTRTIPIYILIENPKRALRGGMFAIGRISLQEKNNVLAISPKAIRYHSNGEPFVFKVTDNYIEAVDIQLAEQWGESQHWEVTRGLNAGDTLVVLPLPGLKAGDAVQVIED